MYRYKLTIEYDGRFFCGWQRQKNILSVQEAIETAVRSFSGQQDVLVYGSGRTDAGVHALGQVAHVDLEKEFAPYRVMDALNFYLRAYAVTILAVDQMPTDFHARFSAKSRSYVYRIINRRGPLAIETGRAWHVIKPLDTASMQEAAQLLVGLHDFNSFRAIRCQAASSLRMVDSFTVTKHNETVQLEVQSRSFLHNQVRIMVGSLVLIGEGKWTLEDLSRALALADRREAGPTAPPDGLYFSKIIY
ncbi:tRNA pseudouridine(38-40) synthase TruA [Candidatus Paracaedibacter symbiosus]|uniref:tRNA pseudouridine(38-40) synthase TruA n=1 Tax=Candidatus Paracaedibacter symbiosus TaxID=244582 RepID=UPI0005099528|nr:tRNA pseudouridine(38-40) synthase TruA [Candidatus Paracaedibacter symbiosus]